MIVLKVYVRVLQNMICEFPPVPPRINIQLAEQNHIRKNRSSYRNRNKTKQNEKNFLTKLHPWTSLIL